MAQGFKSLNFIERLNEAEDAVYIIVLKHAKVKFVMIFSKICSEATRNKSF